MIRLILLLGLTLALMLFFSSRVRADHAYHNQVLVFIPAYEGSKLYDPDLVKKGEDPPCVWGGIDAIRTADLYLSLRMPNPLDRRAHAFRWPGRYLRQIRRWDDR